MEVVHLGGNTKIEKQILQREAIKIKMIKFSRIIKIGE